MMSIKLTTAYHVAITTMPLLGRMFVVRNWKDGCLVRRQVIFSVGIQFLIRTVADLAPDQIQKEQTEDKIQAGKAHQSKNGVAAADDFAVSVARAKKAVDEPGLTSQLRRHPA